MGSFDMLVNRIVSSVAAGMVVVIIGFASSAALIYQTVINLGGDTHIASSWLLVLGLTIGGTSIGLSLYYRLPILIAWSTPGAALLIANGQGFNLNEAIAGFIFSGGLILLCGVTGWFEKLISKIPFQLASAMLAGILINFGIGVFNQMNEAPWIVIVMLATYFISKQIIPKFSMLLVLLSCMIFAWQFNLVSDQPLSWQASEFYYIAPHFTMDVILGISLPLFIVTMAAQNLPGIAVFKAHNYDAPVSAILSVTGFVNMVTAPFGCYAINLAAITAAICMTDEVSEKPSERYWAAIAGGIVYLIMAIFSGYLMSVFAILPDTLIYSLAGIALFSTIGNSLQQAVVASNVSEASIITFIVTASNITLWGVSSVLWGLMAGGAILLIQKMFKRQTR
tara:strand:- start:18704 stop:19888 length:1185 start_codon:yes stop_codon:yes gene_type:complete